MHKFSNCALCLLFLSSTTLAQEEFDVSRWYLGADIGQGYYTNGGNPEAEESVRHRLAGGLHLGYQFNPYFSTELAYQYLGKPYAIYHSGKLAGEFQQGVLSARLGYPLMSGSLTPYLKIGGAAWSGDVDGIGIHREADGFSPVFGAGLSYALSDRVRVRLEYQLTQSVGDKGTLYADHHLTTLGVSWHFGHSSRPVSEDSLKSTIIPVVETVVEQPIVELERETYISNSYSSGTLFATDSSVLTSPDLLEPIARTLNTRPYMSVHITGHTDSTGRAEYNQRLSEKRAQSVANYLIGRGVSAERITVEGKGLTSPIADNRTLEGRAMNRRVEIVLQGQVQEKL